MRDALVAELIGDVDTLIQEVKALQASMPASSDNAARVLLESSKKMLAQVEQSSQRLRLELKNENLEILAAAQKAANEATYAAQLFNKGVVRLSLLAVSLGGIAGLIAGVFGGMYGANAFFTP